MAAALGPDFGLCGMIFMPTLAAIFDMGLVRAGFLLGFAERIEHSRAVSL